MTSSAPRQVNAHELRCTGIAVFKGVIFAARVGLKRARVIMVVKGWEDSQTILRALNVCGLMIVPVAPGLFTEIHRFANGWFALHPRNGVVVATGAVDSSKYYCLGLQGVVRRLKQPITFKAV